MIVYRQLGATVYQQERFTCIEREEATVPTAYLDTADDRNPTIGIGFNLRAYMNEVAGVFGVNPNDTTHDVTTRSRDSYYLVLLREAANRSYANDAALQAALDEIMGLRADDPFVNVANKPRTFTFSDNTDPRIRQAFDVIVKEKEDQIDVWLPGLIPADSNERVALVSLAYSSRVNPTTGIATLLGNKLRTAILNGDRAEAWYEIRYDSNADGQHASRRYREADLFALYNASPTEADYKAAYRMLTRHKDTILGVDGMPGGAQGYEDRFPPSAGLGLEAQISPATGYLRSAYGLGGNIAWHDIFVDGDASQTLIATDRDDALLGEGGADALWAGGGSDVLVGGLGNDTLYGGLGDDTYIYRPGDGHDTIFDADGLGNIRIGSGELTGSTQPAYHNPDEHVTTWEGDLNGQKVYYQLLDGNLKDGGTLELSGEAFGAGSLTIKNFKNGDLGLDLSPALVLDIKQGTGQNPIDSPDYAPQGGSGTLTERTARFFTVFLNIAAQTGDKIKLTVDNLADKLSAIVGDQIVSFAGGQVELTLTEGQTEVSFGLWDKEALDQPETLNLSATLVQADPDPNTNPATASFSLSLLDNRNPDPLDIQIGNTIEGDQAPLRDANGNIQRDQWGNIIPTGPEPGRSDTINDTPNNDRINAGAGDDVVNLFRGGQDEVDAGAGNDWVFAPRYSFYDRVHLMGGAGDDALGGGVSDDVLEGGTGRDSLHGGQGDDKLYADAEIDLAAFLNDTTTPASGQRGDWLTSTNDFHQLCRLAA